MTHKYVKPFFKHFHYSLFFLKFNDKFFKNKISFFLKLSNFTINNEILNYLDEMILKRNNALIKITRLGGVYLSFISSDCFYDEKSMLDFLGEFDDITVWCDEIEPLDGSYNDIWNRYVIYNSIKINYSSGGVEMLMRFLGDEYLLTKEIKNVSIINVVKSDKSLFFIDLNSLVDLQVVNFSPYLNSILYWTSMIETALQTTYVHLNTKKYSTEQIENWKENLIEYLDKNKTQGWVSCNFDRTFPLFYNCNENKNTLPSQKELLSNISIGSLVNDYYDDYDEFFYEQSDTLYLTPYDMCHFLEKKLYVKERFVINYSKKTINIKEKFLENNPHLKELYDDRFINEKPQAFSIVKPSYVKPCRSKINVGYFENSIFAHDCILNDEGYHSYFGYNYIKQNLKQLRHVIKRKILYPKRMIKMVEKLKKEPELKMLIDKFELVPGLRTQ